MADGVIGMVYVNDYDSADLPTERALREAVASLRQALREVAGDVERVLERLDKGQRPSSSMFPGRAVDATKANAYAAQMEALLALPWGEGHGIGNPERADEIVRTAGRVQ